MKKDLILLGGGGHCKSCIDVIEQEGIYKIVGILDMEEKLGEKILDYEIIGTDANIPQLLKTIPYFFITVGQIESPKQRIILYNLLNQFNVQLPVIISPYAYVSSHSKIGIGSIIMHHAMINAGVNIGVNCIINSKVLVEHDSIIGDYCHISTAATINGGVEVGEGTFFGSGAVSVQYKNIPAYSFIKANSLFNQ